MKSVYKKSHRYWGTTQVHKGDLMSEMQLTHILNNLRREFTRVLDNQIEELLLFGSQSRREARPDSDIDVLVVIRGETDYSDLFRRTSPIVAALSLQHDVVISRTFVSKERFDQEQSPFLLNVRREAVPL